MTRLRAIIIGAGIVGAACADALAADGHEVTVLDAAAPATGSTAAGMGHLVVMDDSPALLALTAWSVELWRSVLDDMPARCDPNRCGTLWVAVNDEEMAEAAKRHQRLADAGVATSLLDARETRAREPHLREDLVGALHVPDDATIYQPAATQWLLDRAASCGATVRAHTPVASLDGSRVLTATGETLAADRVIVAAGCDSPRFVPGCGVWPRKGQLAITDRHPGFVRHQLVELGYVTSAANAQTDSVAFNLQPRRNGQILIGSSRQASDRTREVNRDLLAAMIRRAIEYTPGIGDLSIIRTWTGFRPASPDKLPLIGPTTDPDNGVWLATGHEGLGITTALATGRLIADRIAGRTPLIDADALLPRRVTEVAGA